MPVCVFPGSSWFAVLLCWFWVGGRICSHHRKSGQVSILLWESKCVRACMCTHKYINTHPNISYSHRKSSAVCWTWSQDDGGSRSEKTLTINVRRSCSSPSGGNPLTAPRANNRSAFILGVESSSELELRVQSVLLIIYIAMQLLCHGAGTLKICWFLLKCRNIWGGGFFTLHSLIIQQVYKMNCTKCPSYPKCNKSVKTWICSCSFVLDQGG